jgi:uncharacterized protein (TIGR04255 family)
MPTNQPCYERDFLSLVVLRVDFPPLAIVPGTAESPFAAAVIDRFPYASGSPVREMTVSLAEGGAEVSHVDQGLLWVFRKTVDGTCNVSLGHGFLTIEYGPADYSGYDNLYLESTQLLLALQSTLKVKEFSRVGLRYVNEIRLPGRATDWDGIIAPNLAAAAFARPIAGGRLQRSMHQISEIHDDNQLILSYGLPNPDYPAALVQRHFVLDIDCSRSGAIPTAEALEAIGELNTLASNTFESSIGDSLREHMGRRK